MRATRSGATRSARPSWPRSRCSRPVPGVLSSAGLESGAGSRHPRPRRAWRRRRLARPATTRGDGQVSATRCVSSTLTAPRARSEINCRRTGLRPERVEHRPLTQWARPSAALDGQRRPVVWRAGAGNSLPRGRQRPRGPLDRASAFLSPARAIHEPPAARRRRAHDTRMAGAQRREVGSCRSAFSRPTRTRRSHALPVPLPSRMHTTPTKKYGRFGSRVAARARPSRTAIA